MTFNGINNTIIYDLCIYWNGNIQYIRNEVNIDNNE